MRIFRLQNREDSTSKYNCCVLRCNSSGRFNSFLSFFTFPKDDNLRKKWVINIRRSNILIKHHTRVCSLHFLPSDVIEWTTRRRLKRGAVPVLFEWNNFSFHVPRDAVGERRERPESPMEDLAMDVGCTDHDHDYCSRPEPAPLDLALGEELNAKVSAFEEHIEKLVIDHRFGLERFSASDDDIRFYTRFASYAHLMAFWRQIEPAIGDIVRGTRAQIDGHGVQMSLQPIDEFFLFLNYLSLGPAQKDLGHRFKVHQSTVSRVITTWINFLYIVLGAIGIWLDEETMKQYMPEVFSTYADTQTILDCIQLHYQIPDSLRLQTEVFSNLKSHSTFKGLIGMAPHGPVTFISPLYEGSISDREILKRSGLVDLLNPTMAVMVDQGFQVEDHVPCKVHILASKEQQQLSGADVRKTQSMARLRVHVECVIGRVKEHKLLDTVIPMSLSGCINQLFAVACLLTNYQSGPIVKECMF